MARRWDPWYLTRYLVTILGSSGVPHWVFCIEVLRIESARRAYAYGFTSPSPLDAEYVFRIIQLELRNTCILNVFCITQRARSCVFVLNTYLYYTIEAAKYVYSVSYRAAPSVFSI